MGGLLLPCMTIPPSFSCENATSLYTREAFFWFSPYYLVLPLLIVGDDVLGVPFIKISLCFVRTTAGRPYRFGGFLNLMPVGEGSPIPPCLTQCYKKPSLVREGGPLAVDE